MKNLLIFLHFSFITPLLGQITLTDKFNRNLVSQGVTLVDWEGYLANPAIELRLSSVSGGLVIITANHSRLYFDMPSNVGASGPFKAINVPPNSTSVFYFSIFPDRDGINENYIITLNDGINIINVPINVIDQDQPNRAIEYNILKNYTRDNVNYNLFSSPTYKAITNQAADDYAYFFANMNFDQVATSTQSNFIWNDNFLGGTFYTNSSPYTGFEMYFHGTHNTTERSGGQPSNSNFQTINGSTTQLRRSGTISAEVHGNYNSIGWDTNINDDTWYLATNLGNVPNDFYSIMLHEMGHSLGFNPAYPIFNTAKNAGTWATTALVNYQGSNVPIDVYDHLSNGQTNDGLKFIDHISKKGAFGSEYANVMPWGRWLISKVNLLSLQAVGYTLRSTTPFENLTFTKNTLNNGSQNMAYNDYLSVKGGVQSYKWDLISGSLPTGLSLNSFTGYVTGIPTQIGTFNITVQVTDQDNQVVTQSLAITISGIVPIELINFTATPLSKTTQLNWQTTSEKNARHFDVERSNNGKTFDKIGQIKANGNSATLRSYNYVDEKPNNGINYYRLRQVDEDSKATLSNTVSVTFNMNQKLQVFPNPAKDRLTIISESASDYVIFNTIGQEMRKGTLSENRIDVDISNFPTGIYLVKTKTESIKFLKQ